MSKWFAPSTPVDAIFQSECIGSDGTYRHFERVIAIDDEGDCWIINDKALALASRFKNFIGLKEASPEPVLLPAQPGWFAVYGGKCEGGEYQDEDVWTNVFPVAAWSATEGVLSPLTVTTGADYNDPDDLIAVYGPGENVPSARELAQKVRDKLGLVKPEWADKPRPEKSSVSLSN